MWRRKKPNPVIAKVIPKIPTTPQAQLVRRQIIIGVILFTLIAAIVSLVGYVTRLPSLQIKDVHVTGGFTIPPSVLKEAAQVELLGMYFRLIPKSFSHLYPYEKILQATQAISRVKNVAMELDDDNVLQIVFEEYQPHALWCKDVETENCLFVDRVGYAFASAPSLTGGAFVRYVTSNEPAVGSTMTDSNFLGDTATFIENMESELSLFVTHVIKKGDFDIEYQVAGGGRIKVSQSMSADDSFNNLLTILRSEDFVHLEPGTFNYIDLRFGDKVFVNEVTEEVATSTATTTPTASSSALLTE